MPRKKTDSFDFEQAMQSLDKLVEEMENGGLSLEESLKHFEAGVKLTRECQTALKQAEQKVNKLIEKHGELILEPFADDLDEED